MFGFKAKRAAAAAAEACSSGQHARDRNAVRHDGGKLTAPCEHCGVRLTRTATGWRPELPENDYPATHSRSA